MEPPAHVQMNYSEYTSKFQVSLTRAIINQGQLMPMSMETLLNNQKKEIISNAHKTHVGSRRGGW